MSRFPPVSFVLIDDISRAFSLIPGPFSSCNLTENTLYRTVCNRIQPRFWWHQHIHLNAEMARSYPAFSECCCLVYQKKHTDKMDITKLSHWPKSSLFYKMNNLLPQARVINQLSLRLPLPTPPVLVRSPVITPNSRSREERLLSRPQLLDLCARLTTSHQERHVTQLLWHLSLLTLLTAAWFHQCDSLI